MQKREITPIFVKPPEAVALAQEISKYKPDNKMWERFFEIYHDPQYGVQKAVNDYSYHGSMFELFGQLVLEYIAGKNFNPFLNDLPKTISDSSGDMKLLRNRYGAVQATDLQEKSKSFGDVDALTLVDIGDTQIPFQIEIKLRRGNKFIQYLKEEKLSLPTNPEKCNKQNRITRALTGITDIADGLLFPRSFVDRKQFPEIARLIEQYERIGGIAIPIYGSLDVIQSAIDEQMTRRNIPLPSDRKDKYNSPGRWY